ncbi:MAG: GGDEF domain-containing protein [Erysipelotrichaceae bacterium]|nr:GGDEF domain-containing protein [Erysipelotrichaceae bacterium]
MKKYDFEETEKFRLKNETNLEIPPEQLKSWQSVVDLIATIGGARAGLIMRLQQNEIAPIAVSQTAGNPYRVGTREVLFNSGLYCERVIGENQMLFVPDARKTETWKNNPDIANNMICYLGFPIHLPNGGIFGTICILDDKMNQFSPAVFSLVEKMRDLLDAQLRLIYLNTYDQLTNLYNFETFYQKTKAKIKTNAIHNQQLFLLMIDIDNLKRINDQYGHLVGDQILRSTAAIIAEQLNGDIILAHYARDEFILLIAGQSIISVLQLTDDIRSAVDGDYWLKKHDVTYCYGIAEYTANECFEHWFNKVDSTLLKAKKSGLGQVGLFFDENLNELTMC